MKKIVLNNTNYELIKNYKDGFNLEEVTDKYTDYFDDYDYIFGDWAYGKLRLKGFCDRINKIYNHMNDIRFLEQYIKDNCAYECRYFVLKKIKIDQ